MLIKSAVKNGIRNISSYSDLDFSTTSFYKEHEAIASQPRGAGYWIWKPYYILQHLKKLEEGEVLVYCDAGVRITEPLDKLVDVFKEKLTKTGVMLFHNYQGVTYMPESMEKTDFNKTTECRKNKYWAKRDVFILMGLNEERYWNSMQVEGCFAVFSKTDFSLKFVEEWLHWSCNEQVLTDLPNNCGKPNFPNFIMHIHDQAILALLAEKHNLELFRCASQFGNHMKIQDFRKDEEFLLLPYSNSPEINSPFGTILDHHRTKKMPFPKQQIFDLKVFIKQKLLARG